MALTKSLNLLGKEVTATCADSFPDHFDFLPDITNVRQHIPGGRDFVVTLDCDQTEVDRLKYHLEDNKIHIVITPKKGHFVKENVSCHEKGGNYDLIITVDVADIPQLGTLYDENADLFSSVPVINIDHHVSNTNFGKINFIDVAASSTAEMLYGLIRNMERHFGKNLIVPDVATFLLSGVTTDTGSFQNANTTPRAMEVAAELMDAGANQHDVIKYLFRTKKLSTLKLWGKILSKIEVDSKHRMVWSSITQQDLKQSGAHMDEAGDIIDELMVHAPEAEMVALFKEDVDMISVSFRSTTSQANVMEVAKRFGGGGHVQAAGVKFPGKTLPEVMNQVLAALQEAQQVRLGLDGIQHEPVQQQQAPKVTQVLDGYTPPAEPVRPSLEEKALGLKVDSQEPGAKSQEPRAEGQESRAKSPDPRAEGQGGLPVMPKQPDLHDQTRAAITAEQSQSSGSAFQPSQGAQQQRPEKPQVEKRFEGEVPDYLKIDSQEPRAQSQEPRTEGQGMSNEQGPMNGIIANGQGGSNDQNPMANDQGQTPVPTPPPVQPPQAPSSPVQPTLSPAPEVPAPPPLSTPAPQPPQNPQPLPPQPAPQTPPVPPVAPKTDDGVKVSYGNASVPPAAPTAPTEDSAGVVVKNVGEQQSGVGGQQSVGGTNAQGPMTNGQGGQGSGQAQQTQQQNGSTSSAGDQGGGAAGAADASQKPEPPKDPFALGDDGLTDIERALGGL